MTNELTAQENASNRAIGQIDSQELEPAYFYHRDPAYRPWVIASAPKKPTPYEEILALMARHLNYAVIASKIVFVFSIIILLDLMLPKALHDLKVVGYDRSASGN